MAGSKNHQNLISTLRPIMSLGQIMGVTFPEYIHTKKFRAIVIYRVFILSVLFLALLREIPTIIFWSRNLYGVHGMLAFIETRLRWIALILNFLLTCYANKNINATISSLLNSPLVLKKKEYSSIFRTQILLIVIMLVILICYMILGHDFVWVNPYYKWFSSSLYIITEFYLGFAILQFVIFLVMIKKYFGALNENIKKCNFKPGILSKGEYVFYISKSSNEDSITEIVKFRQIHMNLTTACWKTNQCFTLQVLLFMVVSLIEITYSLRSVTVYSVSAPDEDAQRWETNAALEASLIFFWGGYYMWSILQLIVACENTVLESLKTAAVVHELINKVEGKEVLKQLHLFSLQIMNHKVIFSAGKFVTLNYPLLNSIVGTITTYLVIIITFSYDKTTQ